jgi:multidrug resistance efflux pump
MSDLARDLPPGADALHSVTLLRTPRGHRTFVRWVVGLFAVVLAALLLPWQQSVQGRGTVSALRPMDRPQTVPSAIAGQIAEWYVAEGQAVTAGTPLVRISEVKDAYLDPRTVERLQQQLAAKSGAIGSKGAKADALASQIAALERGRTLKRRQVENKLAQAAFLVQKDSAGFEAAALDSAIARDQLLRMENLQQEGLLSVNQLQAFRLKAQQADAKVVEKRNDLLKSRSELLNARIDLDALEAEYGDKIAKARAERSGTLAEVDEGRGEVAKLENQVAYTAKRAEFYVIRAPQDGIVVKAIRAGVGEQIKEGDPIVTVAPAHPQQAVELYVKAMDVPLLRKGRKVRLQFDGWPALQFSGWPSVSVGTFGGVIQVVDQVNGANGSFRVLVVPDPDDEPWPAQLRMGSGVYGWALLDNVRVWFEVWRQLNGFPPSIDPADAEQPAGAKAK